MVPTGMVGTSPPPKFMGMGMGNCVFLFGTLDLVWLALVWLGLAPVDQPDYSRSGNPFARWILVYFSNSPSTRLTPVRVVVNCNQTSLAI